MRMFIQFFFMKMSLHKLTSKYSTGKHCNSWNLKRFLPRINSQLASCVVVRRVFAFVLQAYNVQRFQIFKQNFIRNNRLDTFLHYAFCWTILDLFKFSVLRCCSRESLCLKQFAIAHTLKCWSLNTDYRSLSTVSQSFNEMSRVTLYI